MSARRCSWRPTTAAISPARRSISTAAFSSIDPRHPDRSPAMSEQQSTVQYSVPSPGIARILLDRPTKGNAQDTQMTYDINGALMKAAHDDTIKVIILGGAGKHFSTGHDLKDHGHDSVVQASDRMGVYGDIDTSTVAGYYAWEREVYLDACRRWRSIPKPVIAEVHGACFGGGLMLAWIADKIGRAPV